MSSSASPSSGPIALDDLIALNDEIASLVRAGVPLDLGLRGFSGGVSGTLKSISNRLAERIESGQSLSEALQSEGDNLPAAYRAVVEAGASAGRLPQALESLSAFGGTLVEVRRRISLSLIYPFVIVIAAYYLLLYVVSAQTLLMAQVAQRPGEPDAWWMTAADVLHRGLTAAGHIPPIVLGALLVWWLWSTRRAGGTSGLATPGMRWIPGVRGSLREYDLAAFSNLTAILLEQGVPAGSALPVAAASTGNSRLIRDANQLAAAGERGEPLGQSAGSAKSFPPLMRWMIRAGERQGALAATFRQLADIYHTRAAVRSERFKLLCPLLLTIVVGGGAVLVYTLTVAIPFTEMLKALGRA